MSGGVDHFSHCDSRGTHDLWQGEDEHHEIGDLTDLISDRAVDYVQRVAGGDRPFFLSLHDTAPHWPWETRDDARAGRCHAAPGLPARRRVAAARAARPGRHLRAAAVLAHEPPRPARLPHRALEIPAGRRTRIPVRHPGRRTRARQPERLAALRQAWMDWAATMPAVPQDATASLGYGAKDMPQR